MEGLSDLANVPASVSVNANYIERVNRVLDTIHRNLDSSLTLERLAQIAHFSPYHFHRVFKALVGETLKSYTQRVRLERAVYLLSHRDKPRLTDVALECGFASSSDFSRSFRSHFGVPPSRFDVDSFRREQRRRLQGTLPPTQQHLLARLPRGENPDGFEAKLRDLPTRRVAYLRVGDPFKPGRVTEAAKRLVAWATERGVEANQWLGYMWDDPEIVDLDLCRYDVAVEVPGDFHHRGEVGTLDFPPMRVVEVEVAGPIDLEQRAIDWVYQTWLPDSGCVPDHQPAFEAWQGLPFAHGEAHFELAFQLAIVGGA